MCASWLYVRTEGAWWTLRSRSPLSPLHHTSHWQAISLLDSEFRLRDHVKHFSWWERHSQPGENRVWTFFEWQRSQVCLMGKIMTNDFFLSLFSLENPKFSNRGTFSTAVLVAWPLVIGWRRIRFKRKTVTFKRCFLWKKRSGQSHVSTCPLH